MTSRWYIPTAKPGERAQAKEGAKEAAYPVWADDARVAQADFSPIVFEAFGRCGEKTWRTIRRLAGLSATGLSQAVECRRWIALLGLRLALDQAEILIHS